MQLVTAIVKPHQLDAVKDALKAANVQGVTITEVKGFGRQGGHTEVYRGAEYQIDFLPKMRIDTIIADDTVDHVITTIADAARTGKIGDGKIWVTPITQLLRIRTGEAGNDAI